MDYLPSRPGWFAAAQEFGEALGHVSNYPYAYLYGMFLAISGHFLGRRAYIRYANPLYANHYICLVGPSALSHKSTAMNLGLEAMGPAGADIPVITSVSTAQGLLQAMENNPGGHSVLIKLDEMATVLAQKRQDYAANMLSALTELYGCPSSFGTYTRHNPIVVQDTFTTLIAGSTIEWLQQTLTAHDLMGGFGNRMTFIVGDPRPPKAWPLLPYLDDLDWGPVLRFEGQVFLDESAQEVWAAFYERFTTAQKESTPFVRVLAERIPEKILKAALVMTAWAGEILITPEALEAAIDWGKYLHQSLVSITPAFQQVEHQVLDAIREGYNTRPKLFGALTHVIETRRLKEALDTLKWLGEIRLNEDGSYRA